MTTIVAAETKKGVVFACDSQVSSGNRKESLTKGSGKIVRNGDITIACAGSLRVLNILKHAHLPKPPKSRKRKDIEKWAIKELIPKMRKVLREEEAITFDSGFSNSYSSLLVSVHGRVFEVGGDFAYFSNENRVYSIGSGSSYALGALGVGADPAQAVTVAAYFDNYTGGDIQEVRL